MSTENGEHTFKLKLKLTAPLVERAAANGDRRASANDASSSPIVIAPMDTDTSNPLLIGARGGAALKELLSTAPNPEEAIRAFQATHGLNFPIQSTGKDHESTSTSTKHHFAPAEKLLDLLHVGRSSVYSSLLDTLMDEMLLRIEELPQDALQRVLEATFPYIEFRELRRIPIAILARQDDTPEVYLRELTENRRILSELPVHVRRKILHVDRQELQFFVDQCTQEYVEELLQWYLAHPTTSDVNGTNGHNGTASTPSAVAAAASTDLWNVNSHMPTHTTRSHAHNPWFIAPEERRRHSTALATLSAMIGDSETLYLATLDILKEYVANANIPGTSASAHAKDYVDYVPFLGALRSDLANLQRDKTTALMRTDPLHKFIWFLDRAVKSQNAIDPTQLHELLAFIKKLRVGDVPLNKKFKKKSEIQEEEDNFEIVLGPPPVDQLLTVLDKITKVDARFIFAEPVPDDVPNYKEIIKEPMDLSTMRKKAKKGKYKSLDQFVDDFNLMINNCTTFNPDTTVFYKEGKRVGKRGLEIIEKNAITLRGEPQRIRAKKRKKSGPAETMTMLTSTGVVTLRDFGDVDQTGMVPEGICEETLADVAMILSDAPVKQMLCDTLLKNLVSCWQKRELPTDNIVCRGLVQLLQIGNPASVRRMLRKRDFVLRAPQVVTMRVVLPLLIRSMATFRIGFTTSAVPRENKAFLKDELSDSSLWENMLRASSAIRSVTKAFIIQSLKDNHTDVAGHLLDILVSVEDEILFRDRVFLHTLGEIVLQDVKSHASGSDHDASATDALKSSAVWRTLVDRFFVSSVRESMLATKRSNGSIVQYEDADDAEDAEEPVKSGVKTQSVRSFPAPILHEKAVMVLSAAVRILDKAIGGNSGSRVVASYVRQTLGLVREHCSSLEEFEVLWDSQLFQQCRGFYESLLARCPELREEIFSAEYAGEDHVEDIKEEKVEKSEVENGHTSVEMDVDDDADREAGEVDEDSAMKDEP